MKRINKIIYFLLSAVIALSSCKKEEVPPKTNGEKNAEELQKIINDNQSIADFQISVSRNGVITLLNTKERISFENQYMVFFLDKPYFKNYYDLTNMLYFEFHYVDKDSRIIRIYF